MKAQQPEYKLFIKNIPQEISVEEIRAYLRPLLSDQFFVEKGKNKGEKSMKHALLVVSSSNDFLKLIDREFKIKSKIVSIRPYLSAEERIQVNKDISSRRIYLTSSKSDISNQEIKAILLKLFGPVESCFSLRDQKRKLVQATVTFRQKDAAQLSLNVGSFIEDAITFTVNKRKNSQISDFGSEI